MMLSVKIAVRAVVQPMTVRTECQRDSMGAVCGDSYDAASVATDGACMVAEATTGAWPSLTFLEYHVLTRRSARARPSAPDGHR